MDSICTSPIYWNAFYNISEKKVSETAWSQSWRLQFNDCIFHMDYQMLEGNSWIPDGTRALSGSTLSNYAPASAKKIHTFLIFYKLH